MRRNDWRDGHGGGAVQRTQGNGGGEEVLGGCGGASAGEGEGGMEKMRVRLSAGGRWGVEGTLWPGSARVGQGAGDARPWLATTRRTGSEPVGHQAGRFSSSETEMGRLTAGFQVDISANPWLLRANILNRNGRPMYQLHFLFKDLMPIRNRN